MNERIKELAVEAGLESADFPYDEFGMPHEQLKFAELLIKDCLQVIVDQSTLDTNEDFREGFSHGRKLVWAEIRNRFGVKV